MAIRIDNTRYICRKTFTNGRDYEVKEEISEISIRLKELRKEILLIDDIAERSNEIEEKLEQAEIDEQKKLQKEEKYRE